MATPAPSRIEPAAVPLDPPRFGLLSAASVVVGLDDPHARNGVQYPPNPLGDTVGVERVVAVNGPSVPRTIDDAGIEWASAPGLIVFGGFSNPSLPLNDQTLRERATAILAAGESAAVEAAMWSQLGDDGDASLIETATVLGSDPVSLPAAVGLIEEWFWPRYGGTPVIHANRQVAAHAAKAVQLNVSGGVATTTLGTRWSFGGYSGDGPTAPAPAGATWLVATGQVKVRRSDITVYGGTMQQAVDRHTNVARSVAARTYVVSWDDIAVAIPVTLAG
ncbi:hypothetical protein OG579_17060 [Williamsia herbipolensis]|uniref:Uncharacterized protein n=1 Tax=Williamsia herbipolensis TaxID=1603258 RepID=A0AAU4JZX9_9NOCA|nr:hypothetical protein [Williamsia herbipolensis]